MPNEYSLLTLPPPKKNKQKQKQNKTYQKYLSAVETEQMAWTLLLMTVGNL